MVDGPLRAQQLWHSPASPLPGTRSANPSNQRGHPSTAAMQQWGCPAPAPQGCAHFLRSRHMSRGSVVWRVQLAVQWTVPGPCSRGGWRSRNATLPQENLNTWYATGAGIWALGSWCRRGHLTEDWSRLISSDTPRRWIVQQKSSCMPPPAPCRCKTGSCETCAASQTGDMHPASGVSIRAQHCLAVRGAGLLRCVLAHHIPGMVPAGRTWVAPMRSPGRSLDGIGRQRRPCSSSVHCSLLCKRHASYSVLAGGRAEAFAVWQCRGQDGIASPNTCLLLQPPAIA